MSFSREKHLKFWRMNATLLPHHYLSNDSSRMTLGFFIVAALDLLDALDTIKFAEKQAWIEWIYSCQCSEGGFRGFSGTNLNETRTESNRVWDPANVPATFFALATLLVLGDGMQRVKRAECLRWLPKVQRTDGSFGEVLGENDTIEGGRDLRYCCCAAGVAFILQSADEPMTDGIDLTALVKYIESCQNYNGGFGESPCKEPHSGLTYCAIASLAFVRELQGGSSISESHNTQEALRWMIDRQTDLLEEDEEEESDEDSSALDTHNQKADGSLIAADKSMDTDIPIVAGFNGREGKVADTCYCFWNTGALAAGKPSVVLLQIADCRQMLGHQNLIDAEAMKLYLLEKVQHMIGGFGKGIGAPPDVMHSYLGLAALSIVSFEGLKPIDPGLCISQDAASRIKRISWKQSSHQENKQ